MVAESILTVREGIDVRGRAAELDLEVPETFAVLPFNFDVAEPGEELLAVDQTDVLRRRVFAEVGVTEEPVEADEPLTQLSQRWGEHLYLPTIHFAEDLVANRWEEVAAMIGLVEEYYSGLARELDVPDDTTVEVAFNCEVDGRTVQFVYEDHPDRLDRVVALMAEELDK